MKNDGESLITSIEPNLEKNDNEKNELYKIINFNQKEFSTLHEKAILREKFFTGIMLRASAAIAEYKTKSKLSIAFQKRLLNYAEKLVQYKLEISNLKSTIENLQKKIYPSEQIISKLKNDISKHIFLYKDKDSSINNTFLEIENILFEYSREIESDKFEKIISNKKILLKKMFEDIENLEIKIVSMELEKLTRQNDIQSDVDEIQTLNLQLEYLKNESTQKELLGLLSITGDSMEDYSHNFNEKINESSNSTHNDCILTSNQS